MTHSKLYFPTMSSFCEYNRFVPQLIKIVNTYVIKSELEINDDIETLRKETTFNYNQYSGDDSFEFKLFDNHLHYNSYTIQYRGETDSFSINFSRSEDFPYGMVQFEYNSSIENSLLQSKIIEMIDIYSKMIETSYRKEVIRGNYEINLNNNKSCISEQSTGYTHSGSGADYSYDDFINKKSGQSFVKSHFGEDLLMKIIEEVNRRVKYPQFY